VTAQSIYEGQGIDEIEIKPVNKFNLEVEIPGSKSYTNRGLVIAALANGRTVLKHALYSGDTTYMVSGLRAFGVQVQQRESGLEVQGTAGKIKVPPGTVFVGNSGTCMRFLVAFATFAEGKVTLDGTHRMRERPIQDLLDAVRLLGIRAYSVNNNGCPPVIVEGTGSLAGGSTTLCGSRSSQYLSSILMVSPLAKNDVKIEITGGLVSKPYVDMTIDSMVQFGACVDRRDYEIFEVYGNQVYQGRDLEIEADASNASYFFGAAAVTGGRVKVKNLGYRSLQGDVRFVDILERMGCNVRRGDKEIEVVGGKLRGVDADMNEMPDVVQTLSVVAAFAEGVTVIRNVSNMRIKETDRIRALAIELKKLGAEVTEFPDGLSITPGKLRPCVIDTYDDHRMAMSFAIAGLAVPGIRIRNPGCVSKTFPNFFDLLRQK
jgi:3-phosphoshikimate 1-carboxyvinyltransferase